MEKPTEFNSPSAPLATDPSSQPLDDKKETSSVDVVPAKIVNTDNQEVKFRPKQISPENRLVMQDAYKKAQSVFRHTINIDTFASPSGNYDPAMVQRDKEKVAHRHAQYEEAFQNMPELRDTKILADIFEAMVADNVNNHGWLGHNAELIASSDYDDLLNGIDGVVHFKSPGSSDYVALGIDVTFSKNSLDKKLRNIRERIRDGKMARLKYFELPDGGYKGELRDVPNIVLGANALTVIKMSEQWIDPSGQRYLSKHWMQAQLMDMAIIQCEYLANFAKSVGNQKAEEKYRNIGQKVSYIKKWREKVGTKFPDDRDSVFRHMQELLSVNN